LGTETSRFELLRTLDEGVASRTGAEFFPSLVNSLANALQASCAFATEFDLDRYCAQSLAFYCDGGFADPFSYALKGSPCECVLQGEIVAFSDNIQDLFPAERNELAAIGAKSYLAVPLSGADGIVRGHLAVIDRRERQWDEADRGILRLFSLRAAAEMERLHYERRLAKANAELESRVAARTAELTTALAELRLLKSRLQSENTYLKRELSEQADQPIVGASAGLKRVLDQIALVAPTDATVLIHGETGTGKEMIARAIHQHSGRRDGPLVRLNCSAISAGLVESELFGHVKGAFTGAIDRRIGRFEFANGGTLFLDEVSELTLETQAKLLRVLQEREFEPVGSTKTLRVDVRVVAATNRDLAADARSGRFREDLYYRLNVFPIQLPALRERREDIPLLAAHFMGKAARKIGRAFNRIEPRSLERLVAYEWPGNIRDLQNTIERAAILCEGEELVVDWDLGPHRMPQPASITAGDTAARTAPTDSPSAGDETQSLSLVDMERQHIIAVLRRTQGVVEGPNGAARLLNLKPSTARFRIRKLGIRRGDYLTN
jgi:formate hydrogenlyase transcriptional activator